MSEPRYYFLPKIQVIGHFIGEFNADFNNRTVLAISIIIKNFIAIIIIINITIKQGWPDFSTLEGVLGEGKMANFSENHRGRV